MQDEEASRAGIRFFLEQERFFASRRQFLLDQLQLKRGMKLLDVACGYGALTFDLGARVFPSGRVTGIDISRKRLQIAESRKKGRRDARVIEFRFGNAYDIPFNDDSFDGAFCRLFLYLIRDPLKVLREMVRVTRSGGIVVAVDEPDFQTTVHTPVQSVDVNKERSTALRGYRSRRIDTKFGRKLPWIFTKARLKDIVVKEACDPRQDLITLSEQYLSSIVDWASDAKPWSRRPLIYRKLRKEAMQKRFFFYTTSFSATGVKS